MSMTKKDYELIAKAIRPLNDFPIEDVHLPLVVRLAQALKRSNDRFDVQKFLIACNVYKGSIGYFVESIG